jgi:hypothetical protein
MRKNPNTSEVGGGIYAIAAVLAMLALAACAPFHSVPGDVCNDPTQNYTEEFAFECNQSL